MSSPQEIIVVCFLLVDRIGVIQVAFCGAIKERRGDNQVITTLVFLNVLIPVAFHNEFEDWTEWFVDLSEPNGGPG